MVKQLSIMPICTSVLFLIIGSYTTIAAPKDTNWPQWRGSDGTGVSTETNLPAEWNTSKNLRWKTPLPGSGHSSPIVWGNRVFITAEIEGDAVPGAQAVKHIIDG